MENVEEDTHHNNDAGAARVSFRGGHKNKYSVVEFEVLSKVSNVLGLKTRAEMKLIKRI